MLQFLIYLFIYAAISAGAVFFLKAYFLFDYIASETLWKEHRGAFYVFLVCGLILWVAAFFTIKLGLQ